MTLYAGLDIGGTKFMVAAADETGVILHRVVERTPQDLNEGLQLLHEMIAKVLPGEQPAAIGAAIGGPLDWKQGIVSPLHQPEWRDVPLKKIMEKKWHCPFHVDVDTNIAALGEYHFGNEKANPMLYITLSTGMGGGFLVEGKIYRGMGGFHPEIGHQSILYHSSNPEAIHCECGVPDCLEAMVSGNGIRRIYGKAPEHLSEAEWKEVTYNLGQGLRNLATIYLPEVIVLGGGIAVGRGERLLKGLRVVMQRRLHLVPAPKIKLSRLGYDTALCGAIAAAIYGVE